MGDDANWVQGGDEPSVHLSGFECVSCHSGRLSCSSWQQLIHCWTNSPHPITSHPLPTCSHGSRPSSRIGALHGPGGGGSSAGSTPCSGSPTSGGSPPLLATQERAARHAELSAERRKREEVEAARHEAKRLAQLVRAGLQVACGGERVLVGAGLCMHLGRE